MKENGEESVRQTSPRVSVCVCVCVVVFMLSKLHQTKQKRVELGCGEKRREAHLLQVLSCPG